MSYIFDQDAKEKAFWLCNGKKISTIKDLHKILVSIDEASFKCHVNSEKNDFAAWLRDVFSQKEIASGISHAKNAKDARNILGNWIMMVVKESHPKHPYSKHTNLSSSKESTEEKALKHADENKCLEKGNIALLEHKSSLRCNIEKAKEYFSKKIFEPNNLLSQLIDFTFGFIVGAIAVLILIKIF